MAALEREEQVLADRLDAFEALPVEPLGDPAPRRARVRRLDLDRLAYERLEALRRSMKAVTLGHDRPSDVLAFRAGTFLP
jgi:hypothetical protein